MHKKTSSPLYANVGKTKNAEKTPTAQNEPTYCNTVTKKKPQPSQAIYSNINYPEQPKNIYSNVVETAKQSYKNNQYPLYDNLKTIGLLSIYYLHCNN